MHNKHKAIAEERKPKTKTVNYTAKFRIFSKLSDNKDSLKFTTARGTDRELYVSTYLVHLNIIDPLIVQYAMGNGRTYVEEKERWAKLWKIMEHDENCLSTNMSSGFDMVVVTDVQIPPQINLDIFKPKDSQIWESDNEGGIYHKYINYDIKIK
jgi:hypothetical protein